MQYFLIHWHRPAAAPSSGAMLLRGGHETLDSRLGRVPQFDERSRQYPIRAALRSVALRSRTWPCELLLDQGQAPTCVGNAFAAELAAVPAPVHGLDETFAVSIYDRAQELDEWAGEGYEGTSVLAGAKACAERGYYAEYRWAFGIDDLLAALSQHGPAVLGINWRSSMFEPRPSGLLEVSDVTAGGHAILARGHLLKARLKGEHGLLHVVRLRQSWGAWGAWGDCYIRVEDLEALLKDDGEACIPSVRLRP